VSGVKQLEALQRRRIAWKSLVKILAFVLGYFALSALCLVRWHLRGHWLGLDFFSGSYLLLKGLGSIQSLYSARHVFRSETLRKEWWGMTSDPNIVRLTQLLMMGDLIIFLDYSHWQSLRSLARPMIQAAGLAIYVVAKLWQMWTDVRLARYFGNAGSGQHEFMKDGPYRFVRHPRYASLIAGKIGCALIFASAWGWFMALAWTILYTRKVVHEEEHMRQLLGASYNDYSRETARLLPGVY